MTAKELSERQKWSLSQKIDHAVGTIEDFISRAGNIRTKNKKILSK